MFDPKAKKIFAYLGWEQEYFLIDESLYSARPDLMITGRTLFGHNSSKNQQLEDHYFAAIPTRVAEFMRDLEISGHKLGIPIKTRHNEVAPNQFELAPIYGEANLANDQNQMVMTLMDRIARKHGFVVLLHEKPFDGVNGSGKHNNWSLGTDTGKQLLAPGKDADGNLMFVTFFVNVLAAVQRHNGLLKASIASATNAHRLGGNEAPPAIISAFLGRTMTEVLHKLLELPSGTPIEIAGKKGRNVGLVEIPEIFVDNTDRNRTSPFAFTGNRFEFRMIGSSDNIACPNTLLNTIVAEELSQFTEILEPFKDSDSFEAEVKKLLKDVLKKHRRIIFNGDGYTEEWQREAKRRGLPNLRTTPEALKPLLDPANQALLSRYGVFNGKELDSRYAVFIEEYERKVRIEGKIALGMATGMIAPVVAEHYSRLARTIAKATEARLTYGVAMLRKNAEDLGAAYEELEMAIDVLRKAVEKRASESEVLDAMAALRKIVDRLELVVDDALWPLPKYREMLFIY
jgi:glutamine synthetase